MIIANAAPLVATGGTQWLASSGVVPFGVTFSRTGTALYLTGSPFSSATYASAATDVPRFERLPSGSIGWLGEGQTTNLVLNSYDLQIAANWNDVNGVTATLNQTGLLGSANTATLLNDTLTTQRTGIITDGMTIPTAASTFYMRSFTLKDSNTSRFPELDAFFSPGGGEVWVTYNTQTGATLDLGAPATSISPTFYSRDRGLWWEIGFHATKVAGDTSVTFNQFPARGAVFGTFTIATTGSIIVGGMDFVMDTRVPTSPIMTNGAAGTRNAEVATHTVAATDSGFAVAFNCRTAAGKSGDQYLFSKDNGAANRIQIRRNSSGAIVADIVTASALTSITGATVADDTEVKISGSFATNSMNICVNNTLATRNTTKTLPTGLTTQRYFTDHTNLNHWNGHIISGSFGPTYLGATNDAGLQALNA